MRLHSALALAQRIKQPTKSFSCSKISRGKLEPQLLQLAGGEAGHCSSSHLRSGDRTHSHQRSLPMANICISLACDATRLWAEAQPSRPGSRRLPGLSASPGISNSFPVLGLGSQDHPSTSYHYINYIIYISLSCIITYRQWDRLAEEDLVVHSFLTIISHV